MNTYQFLKQCLKESRVADEIYLIYHKEGSKNAQYYLWNKIGGTMLIFDINLEENIIYNTHFVDTCSASNYITLERYAKFLKLVENNGTDSQ